MDLVITTCKYDSDVWIADSPPPTFLLHLTSILIDQGLQFEGTVIPSLSVEYVGLLHPSWAQFK